MFLPLSISFPADVKPSHLITVYVLVPHVLNNLQQNHFKHNMRKKSAAKGLTAQDKTKHSRESEPLIDAIKLVKCIWGKQTV